MKAAVVIDSWKLPIFDRLLKQNGYTFANAGGLLPGTLLLTVETDNGLALAKVISAAQAEAALTSRPHEGMH